MPPPSALVYSEMYLLLRASSGPPSSPAAASTAFTASMCQALSQALCMQIDQVNVH